MTIRLSYLTSFNKSWAEMLNSFASAIKFEVLGSEVPLSHLETACLLTPIASATNSCVILQEDLCCFMASPRDFLVSDFSIRTSLDLMYFKRARTTSTKSPTTATRNIRLIKPIVNVNLILMTIPFVQIGDLYFNLNSFLVGLILPNIT